MDKNWIIQAGIALALVGLFAAAWFRFSRPVRFVKAGNRVAPQLHAVASSEVAQAAGPDFSRRAPSL